MSTRRLVTAAVIVVTAAAIGAAFLPAPSRGQVNAADTEALYADTRLLETINSLRLSEQQLGGLAQLAEGLAKEREALKSARDTAANRQLLMQIREALIQEKGQAELDRLWEDLERSWAAQAQEERAYDQAQDAGVRQALDLLAVDPKQIVALIEPLRDEAFLAVIDAARQVREVPQEEFAEWLAAVSQDLGARVSLGNAEAARTAAQQLRNVLQSLRGLSENELQARREQIAADLQNIALKAGENPADEWVEDAARGIMGEFLNNDRTPVVLRDKLAWVKGG